MALTLVQTEKAFNLQSDSVYALYLNDLKLNKIQIKQILAKVGLVSLNVSIVSSNFKIKRKGKGSNKVKVSSSKKVYIKLNKKDSITEEKLEEINKLIKV
jgi:ribosomal protein L23